MRITASQMKAVEDSVGFPAEFSVTDHDDFGVRSFRPDEIPSFSAPGHKVFTLKVRVGGETFKRSMSIHKYDSVPFEHVARRLVDEVQSYIFSKKFTEARPW